MSVGIVGYGRFGRFASRKLSRHTPVLVHDPARGRLPSGPRVTFGTLAEVAGQDVVLLAVPVSALRGLLRKIRPHLRPGSLVIDVCAVKAEPVRWMKAILPDSVDVLGTHPLFGPDSAGHSVRGKIVVLCPVRIPRRRLRRVASLLEKAGLRPVYLSPGLHDRLMAETIFLTQVVGRTVARAGVRRWPGVTANYRHLQSIVETVRRDNDLLFRDMLRYSPESRRVIRGVRKALLGLAGGAGGRRR
jgi:prephenate dehydrogenase